MRFITFLIFLNFLNTTINAEETRQVDQHEHGVGELNIAIDGSVIDFEFMLPGADIVGFEYEAKSDEDIVKVNEALAMLDNYKNIFSLPVNSNCKLSTSKINLKEEEHDEHDEHDEHEEHDEHDEHEEESHNEFYAKYSFSCGNIQEIDRIEFTYFKTFANSSELEVQFISNVGSTSFEVEGDAPFILTEGKI